VRVCVVIVVSGCFSCFCLARQKLTHVQFVVVWFFSKKYQVSVPVGEDQTQHLELTRQIATAFNHQFKTKFFKAPMTILNTGGAMRVMSLRDGTKKMSKSDESDHTRINLTDNEDMIRLKIKKCKTDALPGVSYDPTLRPEIANLLSIYAALEDTTPEQVAAQFSNCEKMVIFKDALADVIVKHIAPIAAEMQRLKADKEYVNRVFRDGAAEADAMASENLNQIYELVGFPKKLHKKC